MIFLTLILCPRSLNLLSLGLCKALNPTTNLETRKKCRLYSGVKTQGLQQTLRIRRAVAKVNLQRNIAAKQARGAAEEPVQVISTEQGPEVEVGLLCYTHKVIMVDAIPEFLLVIVHRELMNVWPLDLEVKVCVIQVDWGDWALL